MINGYYMVALSALLVSFLLWKEWKRANKAMLWQRWLASVVAAGSLLFMAYPHPTTTSLSTTNRIILTDGFNADSLHSFLQQRRNSPVFSTNRTLVHASPDLKIQWIGNLDSFVEKTKNDTLHVFGNGFVKDELSQLQDQPFIFHPNPVLSSITSVYWQQQLKTGEALTVQGQYLNASAREIKLGLQAFDEMIDSVTIPAKTTHDFSLHTIPKHTGKAVYSLVEISETGILQKEPLPVEVTRPAPLKILFLSASPGFENNLLKNRLAQNGYAVTTYTTLSKNKSGKQFLNMPQQPGNALTVSFFNKFDLLIADDDALSETGAAGLSAISFAIEENGLGLIVKRNDENNTSSFYTRLFPVSVLKQAKKALNTIHTTIGDSSSYKIRIDEASNIRFQPGTQILLQDDQSHIFASGAAFGNGKIVALTLNNTFSMALSGNNGAYQSLWSFLLQNAARKIVPDETWQIYPRFSFINEPVQLQLETAVPGIPRGQVGRSKIYLARNPRLPLQWQGMYWPDKIGWQPLIHHDGIVDGWYVYKNSDWKKLFDAEKRKETAKYAARHPVSFLTGSKTGSQNGVGYRLLALLLLFFTSTAFLWMEQKSR